MRPVTNATDLLVFSILILAIAIAFRAIKGESQLARWSVVISAVVLTVAAAPFIYMAVSYAYFEVFKAPAERDAYEAGLDVAEVIVEALGAYYVDEGHFPEELSLLVPAYLSKLPSSSDGRSYEYELGHDGDFSFRYNGLYSHSIGRFWLWNSRDGEILTPHSFD